MTSPQQDAALNTDREIWRRPCEHESMSYYEPSIHVTEQGGIGINVGGTVYVLPIEKWHALAAAAVAEPLRVDRAVKDRVVGPPPWVKEAADAVLAAARDCAEWHSSQSHKHVTDVRLAEAVAELDRLAAAAVAEPDDEHCERWQVEATFQRLGISAGDWAEAWSGVGAAAVAEHTDEWWDIPCPECGETPESPSWYRHRKCKRPSEAAEPPVAEAGDWIRPGEWIELRGRLYWVCGFNAYNDAMLTPIRHPLDQDRRKAATATSPEVEVDDSAVAVRLAAAEGRVAALTQALRRAGDALATASGYLNRAGAYGWAKEPALAAEIARGELNSDGPQAVAPKDSAPAAVTDQTGSGG